jgi:hypothetical protein
MAVTSPKGDVIILIALCILPAFTSTRATHGDMSISLWLAGLSVYRTTGSGDVSVTGELEFLLGLTLGLYWQSLDLKQAMKKVRQGQSLNSQIIRARWSETLIYGGIDPRSTGKTAE